jgi:peptidoglycan-associated lipoprotein
MGCAHKPESKEPTTTASAAARGSTSNALAASPEAGRSCATDVDCGSRQLCLGGRCVDITPDLAECSLLRVHFELDQALIPADERPKLDRISRCLKADQVLHVTIEGNADERGTDEYNMALGDKRATAVAGYLESLGVSQAQLRTISYGKEKPLCTEHDEECWKQNRRAAVRPQLSRQ